MKKFFMFVIVVMACVINANAQTYNHYNNSYSTHKETPFYFGFGLSKGFPSFSNNDRGNIGIWSTIWRIECEVYMDTGNYDDLDQEIASYYTDLYKTHKGTSYTHITEEKFYSGGIGIKMGYIVNDYISAGVVWEMGGGYDDFTTENIYWSTLNEGWTNFSSYGEMRNAFGVYGKLSYPIKWFVPFVTMQLTTNGHNYMSIGINFLMKNYF